MKRILSAGIFWFGHAILIIIFVTCVRMAHSFEFQPVPNPLDVPTIVNHTGLPLEAVVTVDGPHGSLSFKNSYAIGTNSTESHRLWPDNTPQPRFRINPTVYRLEIVGIIAPPSTVTNVITINAPSGTYFIHKANSSNGPTIYVAAENMSAVTENH